ncbi:hypothetical protein AU255_15540 [Methyloprofundus sedimenti]|uniref:Uncharacterized protein n=1 Tax=Methyloprofundus sedimenti TaxID=1420851 RepID=A0A1V8M265_9GAMM|nr:hypothetical protein [Methyloprofundus sedimenti]OQK15635.1 hypothetical protein AU255_15540 [Methyloprofundus sedimenti]
MLNISKEDFLANKYRCYGEQNPDIMNSPFWNYMVKSRVSVWEACQQFAMDGERFNDAIWCFDRFGSSETTLADGRKILIGGEHEDFYDDDFCIYNDVTVFDGDNNFTIYGYPKHVFPPTDFHTATLVDNTIYIIGDLSYRSERSFTETPLYALDTLSFKIKGIKTQGDKPGWIHNHEAIYLEKENLIYLSGCLISYQRDDKEILAANTGDYYLDLSLMKWSRVKVNHHM